MPQPVAHASKSGGVADWLIAEVDALGVDVRCGVYAEADEVTAEAPDLVIIATGGVPRDLDCGGGDLAISGWDAVSGGAAVAGDVLLFDETGASAASVYADVLSAKGAAVRFVTPDREALTELGPTTSSVAMRDLYKAGVTFQPDHEIACLTRYGNQIAATLRNVLSGAETTHIVDHVVADCGLTSNADIYDTLKPLSSNDGVVDHTSLVQGAAKFPETQDGFVMARIGDAVAGRNIHAALYDAIRIAMGDF